MPRFHFPVRNQVAHSDDDEGRELADIDAARQEARRAAGEILMSELCESERIEFRITIEDEQRTPLYAIAVTALCEKVR